MTVRMIGRDLVAVIGLVAAGCAVTPTPCRYDAGAGTCPICRIDRELRSLGEVAPAPHLKKAPDDATRGLWTGKNLQAEPPNPQLYMGCRPCDCATNNALEPWDEWQAQNARAFFKLRGASAPYPVAIVPGFHSGGAIARYRLRIGLRLLRNGWVAALILSGGHRRSGHNEARYLYEEALRMASDLHVDVRDRLFLEPCACHTLTNLRNSLRLMAAMGLPHGLFISDAQMTGQAALFGADLDTIVAEDLKCPVGRVSFLLGYTPLPRVTDRGSGCRAPLSWSNNPIAFMFPNKRLSIFWVSPRLPVGDTVHTALECGHGSRKLLDCEPDNQDAELDGCLPLLGRTDLACKAWEGSLAAPEAGDNDDLR
ncbi:MAG: YdcF family protein [Deltaproteobacteria bacterium]|nr:YdcF family protein [Deltaproteobacteria bacterium]